MQSLTPELFQSWVENRSQHPLKQFSVTDALFLYGFQYVQGMTEVFFRCRQEIPLLL